MDLFIRDDCWALILDPRSLDFFLEGNSLLRCQNHFQMLPLTFLGIFYY